MEIRPGAALIEADRHRQTDGHDEGIRYFRDYANAPKILYFINARLLTKWPPEVLLPKLRSSWLPLLMF